MSHGRRIKGCTPFPSLFTRDLCRLHSRSRPISQHKQWSRWCSQSSSQRQENCSHSGRISTRTWEGYLCHIYASDIGLGEQSTLMAEEDTTYAFTASELQHWLDTRNPTRETKTPLTQAQAEYIIMLIEKDPASAERLLAEATGEKSDQQGTARRMKGNRPNKLGDTTDKLSNLTVSAPFSATRAETSQQ